MDFTACSPLLSLTQSAKSPVRARRSRICLPFQLQILTSVTERSLGQKNHRYPACDYCDNLKTFTVSRVTLPMHSGLFWCPACDYCHSLKTLTVSRVTLSVHSGLFWYPACDYYNNLKTLTVVSRVTFPMYSGLIWCFRYPPNSDMDYRIFNVRT